jgi:hypothetical protein
MGLDARDTTDIPPRIPPQSLSSLSIMTHYDVFNGDADGICALQQLHLAEREARGAVEAPEVHLVTGVKRDIALLERVAPAPEDRVTALDISLDRNREALARVLAVGAQVRWFDHHYAGEIPSHPAFESHIDTTPDRGTSLLVDDHLGGRFRAWAVVGTFGDNFDAAASAAAGPLGLTDAELQRLRELGVLINYNSYGAAVADLHLAPDALFRRLAPYSNPLDFIADDDTFVRLHSGWRHDMALARESHAEIMTDGHALIILPDAPWARRAGGVYANELAQKAPRRAHALLTALPNGGHVVSVRAPLAAPTGADALCRQFETGGGRQAAAGINRLGPADYKPFVEAFLTSFGESR